jgi:hypothetical protein
MDPQVLFTINGAWFYLSGRVKPQNIWIRGEENPHAIQQVTLHIVNVAITKWSDVNWGETLILEGSDKDV